MQFQQLLIGDLFNTKWARYVKTSPSEAVIVMGSGIGTIHTLEPFTEVTLLWTSPDHVSV